MGGLVAILLAVKAKKTRDIQWDAKEARFKVDGKVIPMTRIRRELGRMELKVAALILSYNAKLWAKEWTLDKWRSEMAKLAQDSHILFGALALGGLVVSARDLTVQRRTTRDLAALKRFARAIKNGLTPSLPVVNNRSRTYLRSWYVTYHLLSHRAHILAGYTEARRRLTPAEHCRTKHTAEGLIDGCWEVARKGWMPILQMPPLGTLVCLQFCKCWIQYRK